MRRAVLAVLLLAAGASGCRIEPTRQPGDDAEAAADTLTPPSTASGDTARVTSRVAGAYDPPLVEAPDVAASGWAIPVLGVEAADLVDTFTASRSEGRSHDAIDILAPRGTPVVAATPGTVQRLFRSDKGGLTVYVLGLDGRTVSYYAHLDAYAPGLEEGQRVARGDLLGAVGDTGNAAPGNTHLHFAVWIIAPGASFWDGEPVNPYGLLAGR